MIPIPQVEKIIIEQTEPNITNIKKQIENLEKIKTRINGIYFDTKIKRKLKQLELNIKAILLIMTADRFS